MTPGSSAERGFTLLEVLVALSVFAVLAAAVTSASQHVLAQSQGVRDRLFASWIADNHLTELRLLAPPAHRAPHAGDKFRSTHLGCN